MDLERVVESIARTTAAHSVFISNSTVERPVRHHFLAHWSDGSIQAPHEYEVAATPGSDVAPGHVTIVYDDGGHIPVTDELVERVPTTRVIVTVPIRRHLGFAHLGLVHLGHRSLSSGEVDTLRFLTTRVAGELRRVSAHTDEGLPGSSQTARSLEQQIHTLTMQSVRGLAGGVAHDFNNALHVIRGHTTALARHLDDPEATARRLEDLARAVDRAGLLVDRLTDISRPRTNDPTHHLIDSTIVAMAPTLIEILGDSIELSLDLGTESCTVLIDPSRLESVLVNLTTNARDAIADAGRVTIRTCQEAGPGRMKIEFSDSGEGMDAATSSRLFEPFFSTKVPGVGTGLGLATVYDTVSAAGGSIDFDSIDDGGGTTISISLPCVAHSGSIDGSGTFTVD